MRTHVEHIPLGEIRVEPKAQRAQRQSWVDYIADNFDHDKLGVVQVAENGDGAYYVVDGQHRIAAMRQRGMEATTPVRALVYTDTDERARAGLFLGLNDTKSVAAIDEFEVAVTHGDPVAVGISRTLKRHGLTVGRSRSSDRVRAVRALEVVYTGEVLGREADGPFPGALDETLRCLMKAWGSDADVFDGRIIKGLGAVLLRHYGEVDTDRLAEKLKGQVADAATLLGKAKTLQQIRSTSLHNAVADLIVQAYNHRMRSNALPTWGRA